MSAEQQPKYLNTSENRVFSKGRQLFGLHLARSAAAKSGVVVLVEGYTDVVALHQIGVGHVVALMGTAMTPEQLTELSRLAPLLVLALDPDGAGEAAMEKAAVLARGSRLELRVAELPDGRDPAELVQDGRAEELRAALEHHEHFVEFRVRRLIRGRPAGTAEERDAILHTAAPLLNVLPEGNLRNDLIALLSDKLGTGAALVEQLVRGSSRRGEVVATGTPAPQPMARGGAPVRLGALEEQERATLAIMLGMGSEGRAALERMEVDDWQVDRVRAAAEWLLLHGFATGELPADDALSAVIRDVMLRVDRVEPRPALLRFEVAQLDLRRLERRAKQGAIPSEDAQREGQVLRERLDLAMDALMQD
jgi:DNA primase